MSRTRFLTAEEVLFIHKRILDETGGMKGVREIAALQSALARPQATFAGEALYPDIFAKTAAMMESLIRNHPFLDGNKRVGLTSGVIMLQLNGFHLTAPPDAIEAFILDIAQGKLEVRVIAVWLREHVRPISGD